MKAEYDSDRYSVYWIHLDSEFDPYIEGYVGVTCDIERRFHRHRNHAELNDRKRNTFPLYRAFRSHGLERFKFDILWISLDKWTAYNIEYCLRPSKRIGYNLSPGGYQSCKAKCSSLSPLIMLNAFGEDTTNRVAFTKKPKAREWRAFGSHG